MEHKLQTEYERPEMVTIFPFTVIVRVPSGWLGSLYLPSNIELEVASCAALAELEWKLPSTTGSNANPDEIAIASTAFLAIEGIDTDICKCDRASCRGNR